MELKVEKEISQTLHSIQSDVKHVRSDVDMLKAVILEDALLTEEEKSHLEKTIEDFRKGKSEEFVPLSKL